MKKLQILGPGCSRCYKLTENVQIAAGSLETEFEIEKVTDINVIMSLGVMMTPALAIDGRVVLAGKVPCPEKLKELIS